jgi:hypothetical protein
MEHNQFQSAIELPTGHIDFNHVGIVTGYGSLSYPDPVYPIQLQKLIMRVLPSIICTRLFQFEISESQLCVHNSDGHGTCMVKCFDYYLGTLFYYYYTFTS